MTEGVTPNDPQRPDTALGQELRSRTPTPSDGYWDAIHARLAAAEQTTAANSNDYEPADTAAPVVRLKPMNEHLPSPTPAGPSTSAMTRQRLLAAAAAIVLIVGVVAIRAQVTNDPDAVTAAGDTKVPTTTEAPRSTTVLDEAEAVATTVAPLDVPADDESTATTSVPTTSLATTTVPAPTTTGAPATSVPSTTAPTDSTTTAPNPVMPNVVGAASIEAAAALIGDACGATTIAFPSPAWDPANPVPEGTVIATWPSAGAGIVRSDSGCTTLDGTTITVFYANPSYCAGPADPIGLGYCPVKGETPTEPASPATTVAPSTTTIVFAAKTMPEVTGAASYDAAQALIAATCGVSPNWTWTFPSPAWDPTNPQPGGTVLGSQPAAGATIYTNGAECFADQNGAAITIFTADEAYCTGPSDPIGLGWCPKN